MEIDVKMQRSYTDSVYLGTYLARANNANKNDDET